MAYHPFLNEQLDIRWSQLTPEHIKGDLEVALEEARQNIDTLANLTKTGETLTYENTVGALDESTTALSWAWGLVSHLTSVCDSAEIRKAQGEMIPVVTEFYSSIALNDGLWQTLKAYGESDAVESLDPVRKRHVTETLAEFRESGADLDADSKARLMEIESELATLTKTYSENVLDTTNEWEMLVDDESELAGLSESAKAAALASAVEKGLATADNPRWRFTLHMPSYIPLMEQSENDKLRHEAWKAMCKVGASGDKDNSDLIWQILELRHEKAQLLGKQHFPDFTTSRRMAKTGEAALAFIDDLADRVRPAYREEMASLEKYRAAKLDEEVQPLQPWEVAYWSERRRREEYAFDDEQLRPYFEVNRVIDGMFELAQKLFGVEIKELPSVFLEDAGDPLPEGHYEVWHPEVKVFEIRDVDGDGSLRGIFYTDWHPRETKRGGAWMNSLKTGLPPVAGNERIPHIGLMCGNMSPAVGDKPSLLTHNEVETVFHEFGHLIHHLFGDVPVKGLNGISVPWDFVELPSQIMENFCWERESLDLFARHHETGEPIPDELFDKMRRARNYMEASGFIRQLSFGKLDLEMHLHFQKFKGRDLNDIDREILESYRVPMKTDSPTMLVRFTHLFGHSTGYAAGYYSYKWAEVLDADAFTRFLEEGVLNSETGLSFKDTILSKGNSEDVAKLYRDFMGRDPDPEALLRRGGLA